MFEDKEPSDKQDRKKVSQSRQSTSAPEFAVKLRRKNWREGVGGIKGIGRGKE